jgi:predicted negative regulator of RcsB-dependent stress response
MLGNQKWVARVLKWVQDRGVLAILCGVGLLALALGWLYYRDYKIQKLQVVSDLLYRAQTYYETQFDLIKKEMLEARVEAMPQSFLELEKRYLDVIRAYPKTSQAQIAALDLSSIYFELKQGEQAQKVLEMVTFVPSLKPLVWLRMATIHESESHWEQAQKMWKYILSDQSYAKSFHGLAKLNLARILFELKQESAALEYIFQVEKEYPDKLEGREAEKLRLYYVK